MNFFAEQDKARRKTGLLVLLMILAVVSLIIITTIALTAFLYFSQNSGDSIKLAEQLNTSSDQHFLNIVSSDIALWAALIICVVVGGGSIFKLLELGGNGAKVAQALGGTIIPPGTSKANERKVLNVVEEMAIASGNPVPQVYLLKEGSINAFAAGTDRRNAVIGVTEGCINYLSREELQGVIAHEFSHIHNGDMRLNLRLVAVLHGILLIGLMGSFLLRSTAYSSGRRDKNRGAQMGAGLVLWVLGYCGVFFGSLIKAAVSRQREFLADASAVQFTRNPAGIAGALKKIGGLSSHALLETPAASEYSHFYFGQGVTTHLGSLTATHPPLPVRIKRIDRSWNGRFITPKTDSKTDDTEPSPAKTQDHTNQNAAMMAAAAGFTQQQTVIESIGNPTQDNLDAAQDFLSELNAELKTASQDPFSARALIYGLLIDQEQNKHRNTQLEIIKELAHPVTYKAFAKLQPLINVLPSEHIIPLIECAMPALKMQSKQQYNHFKKVLVTLIKADNAVSVLEWCIYRIITACYEEQAEQAKYNLNGLAADIATLIAAVVYAGETQLNASQLQAVVETLPLQALPPLPQGSEVTFQNLDSALLRLSGVKPLQKPALLKAIAVCIYADNKVTAKEALLFKAIADVMNCPVPLQKQH